MLVIAPERIRRASVFQVVYGIRSDRLLMKQVDYKLLFRWFVGFDLDDPVRDQLTFSCNRRRFFDEKITQRFFESTVLLSRMNELVSDEHFYVDGTLLDAWASDKSFRPKGPTDGDADVSDFHGQTRGNDTHASTTDADARLMRKGKGKEANLRYLANALMENRHGLFIGIDVRHASGTGERDGALTLVDAHVPRGSALGTDEGYNTFDFVASLRQRGVKPHIARNTKNRRSAIDGRAARGNGYKMSIQVRKRIEQGFGWAKTIGDLRKLPLVGMARVKGWAAWNFAAYNSAPLVTISKFW